MGGWESAVVVHNCPFPAAIPAPLRPSPRSPLPRCFLPPPPSLAPLQNSVLKTWKGEEGNVEIAQAALLKRAKANSDAQLGKYDASGESAAAGERTYEKGYKY